jgi:hypothetical protein
MKRNTVKTPLLLACAALLAGLASAKAATQITLPAPIYLETFDEVQEGSLPTGWTVENHTDDANPGLDLDDPKSDSYKDWVVISHDRVQSLTDNGGFGGERLVPPTGYFVNGVEITNLIVGNFIYAESDVRGGSQVQYLFSKDYDLTGKTNIYLSYYSTYEQNQDNIGAVEYSVDGGTTWLPVVYMIDVPDVVKDAEGKVDGYATMSAPQSDTAHLLDPVTGEEIGLSYGAFIGVKSNLWSTIGPFISGRINDDTVESKRVEFFPLPEAGNKSKVRLRFAQAGTGSWFFGVDNVGFYSIVGAQPPTITQSPESQLVSAGSTVTLKVVATGDALTYQWKYNGNNLAGQTAATLTLSNITAAQAGEYQVVVTSAGGSTPSAIAKIQVSSAAITQDLVTHLTFDNNLTDTSGKNNNGTAVGAPTFGAGKIGQAAHLAADGDYVSLGAPADLNFSTNVNFSISLWTKATEWAGDPSFIGNKDWNSGGNPGYVIATDGDGHLQWNIAGAPGGRKDYDGPPGTFTDHNWHHIAWTVDRTGNAATFVDGKLVDSRAITVNDFDTPQDYATNIGQDGTGFYGSAFTDVDFDDLGIWRRLLTVQEVSAIYDAGVAGKDLTKAVVAAPPTAPQFTGITKAADGSITITWTGVGTLEAAPAVTGPWQAVTGATSPYTFKPTTPALFGRIKQ